jgi:hypothetical protein
LFFGKQIEEPLLTKHDPAFFRNKWLIVCESLIQCFTIAVLAEVQLLCVVTRHPLLKVHLLPGPYFRTDSCEKQGHETSPALFRAGHQRK